MQNSDEKKKERSLLFLNFKFSIDIMDGHSVVGKMAVPIFGTWPTKWGLMTSLKGHFWLPLKFSTDDLVSFNQRDTLSEVQNISFSI